MLAILENFFKPKKLTLSVPKAQKELLELLMANKAGYEEWATKQGVAKIRFHFFYPSAIDFYFDEFKLFTAYFRKNRKDEAELIELKMTETNYDSIRCISWAPYEEVMIQFLTSLEEDKKIALFEKRKTLFEYQSLCTKNAGTPDREPELAKEGTGVSLPFLKPSH